jgi:hypothetical protein
MQNGRLFLRSFSSPLNKKFSAIMMELWKARAKKIYLLQQTLAGNYGLIC